MGSRALEIWDNLTLRSLAMGITISEFSSNPLCSSSQENRLMIHIGTDEACIYYI